MQGPSLFMSQWLCSTRVWYWKEYVVIQYCTSALPAVQGDHCLAALCLSWNWLVGCHSTNKGVFARRRLLLETCSLSFFLLLLSLLCSLMVEIRSSFCRCPVEDGTSRSNSCPTLSPRFLSPSITPPLLFSISFFSPSLPPRPPALEPLQTSSRLCWSIDPHSCVSVASVWAGLCEIGLLIRWRWVAEI